MATAVATVIGLPIGLAIGLGRFLGGQMAASARERQPRAPAGAGRGVPVRVVPPQAPLDSLQLIWTRRVVFIAQTILALLFVVALTAAAVQGLPPGLLAQARLLGAGRRQLWTLAVREARIGVMAAVIAALGRRCPRSPRSRSSAATSMATTRCSRARPCTR